MSVAAASLRFVLTVVVAACEAAAETSDDCGFPPGQPAATSNGGDGSSDRLQNKGQRQRQQRHELGKLLEVLWASGCLEACVHAVGDVPRGAPSSSSGG